MKKATQIDWILVGAAKTFGICEQNNSNWLDLGQQRSEKFSNL
jgi:hypothetical protein